MSCLGACCGRWQASCGSFIKICKQFRSIKTLEIIQRQVTLQPRPLICTHTHTRTQMKMIFTRNVSIIFATFETLEYFAIFNGQCKWEKGREREREGEGGGLHCCNCQARRGSKRNKQTRTRTGQTTNTLRAHLFVTYHTALPLGSPVRLAWPGLACSGLPVGHFIISICSPKSR